MPPPLALASNWSTWTHAAVRDRQTTGCHFGRMSLVKRLTNFHSHLFMLITTLVLHHAHHHVLHVRHLSSPPSVSLWLTCLFVCCLFCFTWKLTGLLGKLQFTALYGNFLASCIMAFICLLLPFCSSTDLAEVCCNLSLLLPLFNSFTFRSEHLDRGAHGVDSTGHAFGR